MRISKLCIKNFRLLKNSTVNLEEDLSLILGKNNCGKTSLLLILDKFLGGNSFSFDDFNTDFKNELNSLLESYSEEVREPFPFLGISLKIFIEYEEHDDLSNIGDKIIMDLDPNNRVVVLGFEYYLPKEKFIALKNDYEAKKIESDGRSSKPQDLFSFVKHNLSEYFITSKKSILFDTNQQKENDEIFTDLIKEKIQIERIINFKWINAKRNVSNKDRERNLSAQSAMIYKKMEDKNINKDVIEKFKDALTETDDKLEDIYGEMFKEIIDDVKKFGGTKQEESLIKITSSLQHKELLEDNTTVVYGSENEGHQLPENFNGLGYMNLISMIFEIKIILHEFQMDKYLNPSDINLLFIEEPEVHTHPQMQRIFIKNIKSLLEKGISVKYGSNRKLQTIITTHSSHIVSESDFEDIKYFKKRDGSILSKNLKDLKDEYRENTSYYKFLKQYLTLHRSDLFFADKAIFIEGDTERILLPAMMKKMDNENELREVNMEGSNSLPLLSQNISIIEVGAYSQVFEKFIDFIGVKSLIVTDIDSVKEFPEKNEADEIKIKANGSHKMKKEACPVSEGSQTSNSSLRFFYGSDITLSSLKALSLNERILRKDPQSKKWEMDADGHILFVYQSMEENGHEEEYHARSFEDSFFHLNKEFIKNYTFNEQEEFIGSESFPSLTQSKMKQFVKGEITPYEMAEGVNRKPSFAMETLLNSVTKEFEIYNILTKEKRIIKQEFSNWVIPAYIKEGLQWLKTD
ncbi:ATP-dependent nuclease [Virgibacillus salinus]|uniref:Predicted ATP-dependent endonuclease of the OLD family, contains P-loop ATPase and TOPRIM domains n=1 Tax=Virgibacillus salinus TaxID=553311 RepID=A0A1H1DXV3_9BACI|nr:ATP-dependent endonuclease [Virgibacillus salinus]SDQ81362.1 Predicted ATP-dependent endonuclease of the OLD family, contains P-loop ATPase and TOPRIM domains [Virgibacillus salinus]